MNRKMTLPNPFLINSTPAVNTSCTSKNNGFKLELNPGPGLPQSQISNYKYVPRPQLHHKMQNSNSYGAQNFPFSCDRCDRGFKSKEQLDAHIAEHVPCGINGCKFVAHPKIVEKHIQMQHETGLAEQIMRLNTPEEIQKWREQRKKNFPSAQNVARRQAEQKEKMARGEVLYPPKNRFAKNDRRKPNQKGKQHQKNHKNKDSRTVSQVAKKDTTIVLKENPASAKAEAEAKSHAEKYLSEGEIESETEQGSEAQIKPTNALTNLLGCYASDSDEAATIEPPAKIAKIEEQNQSQSSDIKKNAGKKQQKKSKKKSPKGAHPPTKQYGPKRLTLLQKLLQGEIRHERNVILQCVHYIVQQNFFGVISQVKNKDQTLIDASEFKNEEVVLGHREC